jgi:hypothetical protein
MEEVRGKSFQNERLDIDGKTFRECRFDSCTFVYSGGEVVGFSECNFASPCQVELDGAALSTARVLAAMWDSNLRPLVLPVVMGIQGKYPDGTPQLKYDSQKQILIGVEFNGFIQNVEDTSPDDPASKYTASFNLHVEENSFYNLSVIIKRTAGSVELDDLEVYPIQGYDWKFQYGPFQEVARQYYFHMRSLSGNIDLNTNIIMENNLNMGGDTHKVYRIVVDRET